MNKTTVGRNKDKKSEMSFWEHLEDLRSTIVRSVFAIMALSVVAFINRSIIFDNVILAPKDSEFITNVLLCRLGKFLNLDSLCIDNLSLQIINIHLSGQFLTHMYVSMAAGFIIASPYVIYQFWKFIDPALKPDERKYSRRAVFVISLLFISGVLFSYFIIVPLTINFLGTYQVSGFVANQISLQSYISTVISVTLGVGLVFELPVLIYFLARIGMVTPEFLRKNRKYTLIIILIIAAIITPPDIFSQILVSIPLLALYEASIYIAKRVNPGNE
ncbi:MAG: twin-arginine translocase subunit TatC [Bacteroidales bacterium]